MPIIENMNNDEIKNIHAILMSCPNLKELNDSSDTLNNCTEMQSLISSINSPLLGKENQITISGYLEDCLENDLDKGLDYFAVLIQLFMVDPEYSKYTAILSDIADAATSLNKTEMFCAYAKAYKIFEGDHSEEAESIRKMIDIIGKESTQYGLENIKSGYNY